jgi:fluoride exporter
MNLMIHIIYVAAGGAAGTVCRYIVTRYFSRITHHSSIYTGTVAVNITGSFLMGILFGYLLQNPVIPESFLLIFMTGFLGSFTTFSTFALEVQNLIYKPFSNLAIYLALQLGAATISAALGIFIGSMMTGGTLG